MARLANRVPLGAYATSAARMKTTPIPVQRSRRGMEVRALTSMPVGKMVPIFAFPLLREDGLQMSRLRFSFELAETVEILANAVNVRVMAYLVPFGAFDRFNGMDQLNRSYAKEPDNDGGQVIPFFPPKTSGAVGSNLILKYLGKHHRAGQVINQSYTEAYNEIWNFRAANRSPDLTKRVITDETLAPAFWVHQRYAHIVPDFDAAVIDGQVPLTVVSADLPVRGIGVYGVPNASSSTGINETPGVRTGATAQTYVKAWGAFQSSTATSNFLVEEYVPPAGGSPGAGRPNVFAELQENGITVSLSNIELARKTQAFAALRKQYTGHDDDYIIDMLMSGLTVPEQYWRQPMLLADRSTVFGMSKRYSTTADDLTASVVNGATFIDMAITTPQCPTGGVVMIVAEYMPEQLFERQQDPFLHTTDQDLLPDYLRDVLDPQKVSIVQNQYIDLDHATPTGTFGYAPLNFQWAQSAPHIGGRFFRPTVDAAFDEDRQRIWAVETANPTLSRDFYLCSGMHMKPFVVTDQDACDCVTRGTVVISGLTVFGPLLVEAGEDYEAIMDEVDQGRIPSPAAASAAAEGGDDAPEGDSEEDA